MVRSSLDKFFCAYKLRAMTRWRLRFFWGLGPALANSFLFPYRENHFFFLFSLFFSFFLSFSLLSLRICSTKAEPQRIVTTRLLYRVQPPVLYLSRLQRIQALPVWNFDSGTIAQSRNLSFLTVALPRDTARGKQRSLDSSPYLCVPPGLRRG